MRTNVFLRSTRRQPLKAAVILFVVGAVTFAFVARAAEYLLVRQETERLSGYYSAVGALTAAGDRWADREEAAAYLASRPEVELVSRYRNVSAVIEEDFCNADTDMRLAAGTTGTVSFYGNLLLKTPDYYYFVVDTPLTGYPEVIRKGRLLILMRKDEACSTEYYDALEVGDRYLAVGFFDTGDPSCAVTDDAVYLKLRPVTEDAFFLPVAPGAEADFDSPALSEWRDLIPFVREQQKSLNALAVEDLSSLPDVQEEGRRIHLTGGRWLDAADTREKSPVCVVHDGFARLRGLKPGDSLTLRLRDVPSYFGYCLDEDTDKLFSLWREAPSETVELQIVGTYEYTGGNRFNSTVLRNNLYIPASIVPEGFVHANGAGLRQETYSYMSYWAYSIDRGYQSEEGPYPGEAAFRLKDPAAEDAFLEDTRADLEALGFRAEMVESGWDNFQAAAVPMSRSSLYNAVIFTVVLAVTLALAAFAYFYMRRRELAVVRAMGLPAGRCAAEVSLPLLVVGLAGLIPGAWLGWRYAGENAAKTLESLSAFGGDGSAALPGGDFAVLCGIAALLLAAVTIGTAHVLVRRPVLRQIQGGAPAGAKKKAAPSQKTGDLAGRGGPGAPSSLPSSRQAANQGTAGRVVPPCKAAPAVSRSLNMGHTLRFVWRHVVRARGRSLLTAVLAAAFAIGLSAIALSIENNTREIEALYETISVTLEMTQKDNTQTIRGGGFLFEDTVQAVLDTGYITEAYLEGANFGKVYPYDELWESTGGIFIRGYGMDCNILAIGDVEAFLSSTGSGSNWNITYAEGWDGSFFAEDWREAGQVLGGGDMLPLLLPRQIYDAYMAADGRPVVLTCKGKYKICVVAGAYDGAESGDYQVAPLVLMPQSALQAMVGSRMLYSAARFTVDPAMNRDLDQFRDAVDALANTPRIGGTPVRVMLRDEELRQAAEPLEESVALMEILYPVMLALSVLAAAAGSALFVLLAAKDAAILRVQGTGKGRVRLMLSLQLVITNLAGLVIGLAGVLGYLAGRQPELLGTILEPAALCGVMYLFAAAAGAGTAAAAVTRGNPLELLQVKE